MPASYAFQQMNKTVIVSWTCSKCGHVNKQDVKLMSSGVGEGFIKSRQQLNTEALNMAQERMEAKLQLLRSRQTSGKLYRFMGIDCACSVCEHREPWAFEPQKPEKPSDLLKSVPILMGLWAFMGWIVIGRPSVWLVLTVVFAAIGILVFVLFQRRRKRDELDQILASLPDSAFPILVPGGIIGK